jgi:hypothetical protein
MRKRRSSGHGCACDVIIERARLRCAGDVGRGSVVTAIRHRYGHYRGLSLRLPLRLHDGTPVARLLQR